MSRKPARSEPRPPLPMRAEPPAPEPMPTPPSTPRRCDVCAAYRPVDVTRGECRSGPPTLPGVPTWRWPVVPADGACERFRATTATD